MTEKLTIKVDESDLMSTEAAEIGALVADERVLGGEGDSSIERRVINALPRAVAKRVESMLPAGWRVAEMEISFSISGTPFGVGISGEAKAKFVPGANG